ncbi:RNA-guided endonuclease InsQ/TnpB family protein [Streptomyces sp. NPDC002851]
MKLVVQVKLLPTPVQMEALEATLRVCNEAASWVATVAFEHGVPREYELRKHTYAGLKTRGLGAQAAQHVIKKACDAYTTLKANLRAGNYGKPGSHRHARITARPVAFRNDAAQPFDDRCLSWQYDQRTVSIWTTDGRLKGVRYTGHPDHLKTLAQYRKGESDLVWRDGTWFLLATCEIPEVPLNQQPEGFIGVDLGIENIATTSDDAAPFAGQKLNRYRRHQLRIRAELQARGTKSAKRKLKRRAKREARHAAHVNHKIAKEIVAEAERTGRGIGLEELTGIRARVRLRKPQRVTLHSWAFGQLIEFIAYKAKRAGVPVVFVDPAYTSRRCSWCGHTEKANRPNQETFICRSCGVVAHADWNAARNIRQAAENVWGAVNRPHAAVPSQPVASLTASPAL